MFKTVLVALAVPLLSLCISGASAADVALVPALDLVEVVVIQIDDPMELAPMEVDLAPTPWRKSSTFDENTWTTLAAVHNASPGLQPISSVPGGTLPYTVGPVIRSG